MKRKTLFENIKKQIQKIESYKISIETGVTYMQALDELQSKNK